MYFLKVLVVFETLIAIAYSSPIESFYFTYYLFPYAITHELERAWGACPENTTNHEKYRVILDEAKTCYNNLTKANHSLCHNLEENTQRCSQPLVDYFIACLPEKAKDLPPAIVKAGASLVEAFCTSSGDLLLETFNPCLYEYLDQRNRTIKEECTDDTLQPKLDKFKAELPSKQEACKVIQEIGNCWQEYVNQDCQSTASKNLFSKFYIAALAPCK